MTFVKVTWCENHKLRVDVWYQYGEPFSFMKDRSGNGTFVSVFLALTDWARPLIGLDPPSPPDQQRRGWMGDGASCDKAVITSVTVPFPIFRRLVYTIHVLGTINWNISRNYFTFKPDSFCQGCQHRRWGEFIWLIYLNEVPLGIQATLWPGWCCQAQGPHHFI